MRIAFLYEHPKWSAQLINRFAERNVKLLTVNVGDLVFNTSEQPDFDAAINRVNIMPSADQDPRVAFQVMHYLKWLEISGVRIVNGSTAHTIGSSKVMQNGVFSSLGLCHPRGIAIYRPPDALAAAEEIGYPVIVKPNIGGSGSGIALFEHSSELEQVITNRSLDLGIDRTGLVQQHIDSDGYVYRVEMLGENLFYSIRQPVQPGSFNYCAADGCSTGAQPATAPVSEPDFDFCVVNADDRIEAFAPPESVVADVSSIICRCQADLGGVEYLLDAGSGEPVFYDFNPYSNFVTDGLELFGFNPEDKYIDFVMQRLSN